MKTRPHINLEVANLEKSVAFYTALLDREPSKLRPDYANFRLEMLHLALVEKPGQSVKPNNHGEHFGFELFGQADLEDWKSRIVQAGLPLFLEEESVTCCYAVANKFWLKDPDGNAWEFWVKTDDEGESLASSNAIKEAACCVPTGGCC